MVDEWPQEGGAAPRLAPAAQEPVVLAADGMVLRRQVAIVNSRGLHARAAAKLVTVAERFTACVNISRHGQTVPACSIMGLMMLGAGKGSEVVIEADGWDAKEAMEAIAGLIEAGFHED